MLRLTRRLVLIQLSRVTTRSLSAAREVTNLMVEQGIKPLARASFWLTMVRIRPLVGSATTTLPFMVPSAATAARRITRSSPSTLSPRVGSTGGGNFLFGASRFLATAAVFRGVALGREAAAFRVWLDAG